MDRSGLRSSVLRWSWRRAVALVAVVAVIVGLFWVRGLRADVKDDATAAWSTTLDDPRSLIAADDDHLALDTARGLVLLDRADGSVSLELNDGASVTWARFIEGDLLYGWWRSDVEAGTRRISPGGKLRWESELAGTPVGLTAETIAVHPQRGPGSTDRVVGWSVADGRELWSVRAEEVVRLDDLTTSRFGLDSPDHLVPLRLPGQKSISILSVDSGVVARKNSLKRDHYPLVDGDTFIAKLPAETRTDDERPGCELLLATATTEIAVDWTGPKPENCNVLGAEDGYAWLRGWDDPDQSATLTAIELATGTARSFGDAPVGVEMSTSGVGQDGRRVQIRDADDRLRFLDGATGSVTWTSEPDRWIDDIGTDGALTLDQPTGWERHLGGADEDDTVQVLRAPDGESAARVHERGRVWVSGSVLPGPEAVTILDDTVLLLRF